LIHGCIFYKKSDINKSLENIKNHCERQDKTIEDLRERIKTFNKDEEIQNLHQQIADLREKSVYVYSETELKSDREFSYKHYNSCKGNTEIILHGTGIGMVVKARCTKCGEVQDISDFSNW
jgi:hypothetical protein